MQKFLNLKLFIILSIISLTGCKFFESKKSGQIIAECYGNYLYRDDLEGLVQPGTGVNDSLEITKQFIDNWILQKVMLHQAENNLTDEQKDFADQIESYRNSLIIYAYESELIKQKLDTVITEQQIEEFYNNNLQNFQLRDNIVKVKYVKIPKASAKPDFVNRVTKLLRSDKVVDEDELSEICQKTMISCFGDYENWIRFDDLINEVPIKTEDKESFLENRTFYETSDSLFVYLVKFKERKMKEGASPLSFEIENIKSLILNRRKIELVHRMQQEVFREAMNKNEFTIY